MQGVVWSIARWNPVWALRPLPIEGRYTRVVLFIAVGGTRLSLPHHSTFDRIPICNARARIYSNPGFLSRLRATRTLNSLASSSAHLFVGPLDEGLRRFEIRCILQGHFEVSRAVVAHVGDVPRDPFLATRHFGIEL